MEKFRDGYRRLVGVGQSPHAEGEIISIHGVPYVCTGVGRAFALDDDAYSVWGIDPSMDWGQYVYYRPVSAALPTPPAASTPTAEEIQALLERSTPGEGKIAQVRFRTWGATIDPVIYAPRYSPLGLALYGLVGAENYSSDTKRWVIPRALIPDAARVVAEIIGGHRA